MNQAASPKRNIIIGAVIAAVIAAAIGIGWAVQANRDTTGEDVVVPGASQSASATEEPSESVSATPSASASATESTSESAKPQKPQPQLNGPLDANGDVRVEIADTYGIGLGDPKAKNKIEIFYDYACPHCRDFEDIGRQDLMDAATSGNAFVVLRPMAFLNEYSERALNAVAAVLDSGNGQATLALHNTFFAKQPTQNLPNSAFYLDQAVAAGADRGAV